MTENCNNEFFVTKNQAHKHAKELSFEKNIEKLDANKNKTIIIERVFNRGIY